MNSLWNPYSFNFYGVYLNRRLQSADFITLYIMLGNESQAPQSHTIDLHGWSLQTGDEPGPYILSLCSSNTQVLTTDNSCVSETVHISQHMTSYFISCSTLSLMISTSLSDTSGIPLCLLCVLQTKRIFTRWLGPPSCIGFLSSLHKAFKDSNRFYILWLKISSKCRIFPA